MSSATPPPPQQAAPAQQIGPAAPAAGEGQKASKFGGLKNLTSSTMGKMKGVSKLPKKTLYILIGILIIVIAAGVAGVSMMGGDAGSSGPSNVDVMKLADWSMDIPSQTAYLLEGTAIQPQSMVFDITQLVGENASSNTYFIQEVTAKIVWIDEADQRWGGRVRENEGDTFQLEVNSSVNASKMSEQMANQHGAQGSIGPIMMSITDGEYSFIVVGNSTGMRLPDTVTEGNITVIVYLFEAGDLYATGPAAFKLNDFGNDFTLSITVKGKVYVPGGN